MVTLVVPNCDHGIAHFTKDWGFLVVKDTIHASGKRWVELALNGGARLRLAEAQTPDQAAAIGRQTGGLVSFFVKSGDFDADVSRWLTNGVRLLEAERIEAYGRIVVLADDYGNRWDVIEAA
jgi:hypothetical protein